MIGRRTLIDLFSSRSSWFIPRSYATKAKLKNVKHSETSKPQNRELDKCLIIPAPNPLYMYEIPYERKQRNRLPRNTKGTPPSGLIPPKEREVKKAVQRILPSIVTVTISTATSEKMYGGIIVDPLGSIVTSAEDMDSQKKEDLSKFKVDVHLNPGTPSEFTLSGEVSYVDLVNKLAIVKCKSDEPLKKMAAKLNTADYCSEDFLLHVSTTCGHNNSLPNSLCADLVKTPSRGYMPMCVKAHYPFSFTKFKSCVFSSSEEPAELFGLAIVNLGGELVGLVKDRVNLCATTAAVISEVLDIAKEFGNCQPWIGVDLFPTTNDSVYHYCHVRGVVPNSPAEMGGIGVGDEIVELGYKSVRSLVELYNALLMTRGKAITVQLKSKSRHVQCATIVPQVRGQARYPFI